jgi:N-methylhydantoinase A
MDDDSPDVRLGVDVGGTFTDVVLLVAGELTTAKVPTTDDQSEGVLTGVEAACEAAGVDPSDVDTFRHATTVSVNALLEGAGVETALVTTEGFGDILAIGRQNRPALYDLTATKPDPLVPRGRRHELDERTTPAGIERRVTDEAVAEVADALADSVESVAVALLHSYASPENERRVADRLRERLDVPVSASHEVLGTFREYERTATTVADAVLRPVVDDYLARLETGATDRGLPAPRVMQANGGIAAAATVREHAVATVLSGPAAGVVGASLFQSRAADALGDDDAETTGLVTFDMGGTSSDVSLVRDGTVERTTEADVGGHPVRIPMVDVNTVGAGGGSVAWVDDGGALRVGPQSAGADPGPACYGKGGDRPTVTDAALELGYLGADTTLGGDLELDADRAETVLATLAEDAGLDRSVDAAQGVYRVANATMTRAIRGVTVERGHDPREFALVAFGGAGPMHAAALAERLGVGTVLVPPGNGVLSALGLLAAAETHDAARTYRQSLADVDTDAVEAVYDDLRESVLADATDPSGAVVEREADCRYAGQSFELAVDAPESFDPETVRERFHAVHERTRGYRLDEPVDLVNCRVTATIEGDPPTLTYEPEGDPFVGKRDTLFESGFYRSPVYRRERAPVGTPVDGPAIFEGGESTVVVPPTWTATAADDGTLVLEDDG